MADQTMPETAEPIVPTANLSAAQTARLPLQQRGQAGFTLAELLVSVGVLVLIVLLTTQLLNNAATITTLGQKQMDADSQARQLLDRMAVDFAHMVQRSDLDYFAKGTIAPNSEGGPMPGNDQIALYSTVPGYYTLSGSPSPVSLVAYRVNAQNKLERMGKGLVWNGVPTADPTSVVFLPLKISETWRGATDLSASPTPAPDAEVIGPQIFRFEYSYLLTDGTRSVTPPANISSLAAIVVDIAVIDPKSKVLLSDTTVPAQITEVASQLIDYDVATMPNPGDILRTWQGALDAITNLPRPAISGIRLYERYFYF